ncbi:MAG: hypothetical protein KGZ60_10995 [Truepera sp.]|nr:hypothetical protein [Truepera sp.]
MTYPAFEARDLIGAVLLKDAALLKDWRAASQRGDVLAVTVQGIVVKDAALVEAIKRAALHPAHILQLVCRTQDTAYRCDPATATVSEPS